MPELFNSLAAAEDSGAISLGSSGLLTVVVR